MPIVPGLPEWVENLGTEDVSELHFIARITTNVPFERFVVASEAGLFAGIFAWWFARIFRMSVPVPMLHRTILESILRRAREVGATSCTIQWHGGGETKLW